LELAGSEHRAQALMQEIIQQQPAMRQRNALLRAQAEQEIARFQRLTAADDEIWI